MFVLEIATSILLNTSCTATLLLNTFAEHSLSARHGCAQHMAEIMYLDMAPCKQILHQSPVGTAHTSMMNGKAMRQDGLEVQVIACLSFSLQTQQACLAHSCSA